MGVAVAIKDGTFAWRKLGDIFQKTAPMVLAYGAVDIFWQQQAVAVALLALIAASLTGGVVRNLALVFPEIGAILPETLTR